VGYGHARKVGIGIFEACRYSVEGFRQAFYALGRAQIETVGIEKTDGGSVGYFRCASKGEERMSDWV
jgi:hypothetical protein